MNELTSAFLSFTKVLEKLFDENKKSNRKSPGMEKSMSAIMDYTKNFVSYTETQIKMVDNISKLNKNITNFEKTILKESKIISNNIKSINTKIAALSNITPTNSIDTTPLMGNIDNLILSIGKYNKSIDENQNRIDNLFNRIDGLIVEQNNLIERGLSALNMESGGMNNIVDKINLIEPKIDSIKTDLGDFIKNYNKNKIKSENSFVDKISSKENIKNLTSGIKTVVLMSAGILAIGTALNLVGAVDFKTVLALTVFLPSLAYTFQTLSKIDVSKNSVVRSIGLMLTISAGLFAISNILDNISLTGINIIGILGLSGALVGLLFTIKNLGDSKLNFKNIILATAAMPIIALGIVGAGMILKMMPDIGLKQGLTAVLVAGAMGLALWGMSQIMEKVKIKSSASFALLPVILPTIALALVLSSAILKGIVPISPANALSALAIAGVVGISSLLLAYPMKMLGKMNLKEILNGALAITAISTTLMTASHILAMGDYTYYPDLKYIISFGVGILLLTPAFYLVGNMDLKKIVQGTIGILAISTALMTASHILSVGKYSNLPSTEFMIGFGIGMIALGAAAFILGLSVAVTAKGALGIVLLSGAVLASSLILSKAPKDVFQPGGIMYLIADTLEYFLTKIVNIFGSFIKVGMPLIELVINSVLKVAGMVKDLLMPIFQSLGKVISYVGELILSPVKILGLAIKGVEVVGKIIIGVIDSLGNGLTKLGNFIVNIIKATSDVSLVGFTKLAAGLGLLSGALMIFGAGTLFTMISSAFLPKLVESIKGLIEISNMKINLSNFVNNLKILGEGLNEFISNGPGFLDTLMSGNIKETVDAIKILYSIANMKIDASTFAINSELLAKSLVNMSNSISNLDIDDENINFINIVSDWFKKLSSLSPELQNLSNLDTQNLKPAIESISIALTSFTNIANNIEIEDFEKVLNGIRSFSEILKLNKLLDGLNVENINNNASNLISYSTNIANILNEFSNIAKQIENISINNIVNNIKGILLTIQSFKNIDINLINDIEKNKKSLIGGIRTIGKLLENFSNNVEDIKAVNVKNILNTTSGLKSVIISIKDMSDILKKIPDFGDTASKIGFVAIGIGLITASFDLFDNFSFDVRLITDVNNALMNIKQTIKIMSDISSVDTSNISVSNITGLALSIGGISMSLSLLDNIDIDVKPLININRGLVELSNIIKSTNEITNIPSLEGSSEKINESLTNIFKIGLTLKSMDVLDINFEKLNSISKGLSSLKSIPDLNGINIPESLVLSSENIYNFYNNLEEIKINEKNIDGIINGLIQTKNLSNLDLNFSNLTTQLPILSESIYNFTDRLPDADELKNIVDGLGLFSDKVIKFNNDLINMSSNVPSFDGLNNSINGLVLTFNNMLPFLESLGEIDGENITNNLNNLGNGFKSLGSGLLILSNPQIPNSFRNLINLIDTFSDETIGQKIKMMSNTFSILSESIGGVANSIELLSYSMNRISNVSSKFEKISEPLTKFSETMLMLSIIDNERLEDALETLKENSEDLRETMNNITGSEEGSGLFENIKNKTSDAINSIFNLFSSEEEKLKQKNGQNKLQATNQNNNQPAQVNPMDVLVNEIKTLNTAMQQNLAVNQTNTSLLETIATNSGKQINALEGLKGRNAGLNK